uniref:Putative conserved secreted protein n=1 Tax=Culex tarsalis TaxID=7177 RepID=A0A1Q3FNV1_CULTA
MTSTVGVMLAAVLCCAFCLRLLHGVPVPVLPEDASEEGVHPLNTLFHPDIGDGFETNESLSSNSTNGTHKDLYVIKAVVYEIGILVDESDNDTLEVGDEPITEQQVDLTFFTHNANKTHINLGDIPLPVATSVHGQVLTGIAPVHIGAVSNLQDVLATLPITGTIVNITQTNSSYIELTKQNISDDLHDAAADIVSVSDLAKLPIESANQPLIPSSLDQTIAGLAAASGGSTNTDTD